MIVKTLTLRFDDQDLRHKAALESLDYIKDTWNIKTDSGAIFIWLQMAQHKTESRYQLECDYQELQSKYDDIKELLSQKLDVEKRIKDILK